MFEGIKRESFESVRRFVLVDKNKRVFESGERLFEGISVGSF